MRRALAETGRAADRVAIAAAVAEVEPDLTGDTILTAVAAAARDTRQLRHLADALKAEPDGLVSGSCTVPREVDRLVIALQAAGAIRVRPPTCAVCGRAGRPLVGRRGRRLCTRCEQNARVAECGGCGRERPVSARAGDGTALCGSCALADPARRHPCSACGRLERVVARVDGDAICGRCYRRPTAVCEGCGRVRPCNGVRAGHPRCDGCYPRRQATCSGCGRTRVVAVVWAAGPVCATCYQRGLAAKGSCEGCGQRRRIDPRNPNGRALCADCAGLAPMAVCAGCGGEDRIWRNRRCFACNLADRLDTLLAGADGTIRADLVGLRSSLGSVESPRAVLRWVDKATVADTLRRLARGELALTHDALDDLGGAKWVAHLRHVLVATATLPARHERLAGLEAWVTAQLATIGDVDDRQIIATFATWWVVRRRRARLDRKPTGAVAHDHKIILWGIRLLAWLGDHDRTLATATQADIDLWLASGPPSRYDAREFVRWARRRRLATGIDIVRRPDPIPAANADVAELALIVRRLLVDDTVALTDRVAGLLVVLYGQPLTRIVALTVDRVGDHDGVVTLRLGRSDIDLPEPVGVLVQQLCVARRGRAALATPDAPWMFPGGHPGRPMGAERLGVRLNALGISVRDARTTMLLELAGEMPAAVIADLLGIYPNTAVRWVRAAGGDWTGYAARRARGA